MAEEKGVLTLKKRLEDELILSMKKRDELRLSVLRLAKSAIHHREIEIKHPLSDDEVLEVLGKEIKKRRESIEGFKKGNRNDLAAKEENEAKILSEYLPPPLPESEVRDLAKRIIQETGAESVKDMGKVMGKLQFLVKHRAPGDRVAAIVREELTH